MKYFQISITYLNNDIIILTNSSIVIIYDFNPEIVVKHFEVIKKIDLSSSTISMAKSIQTIN